MWAVLYVLLHGHPMPPLARQFEALAIERNETGANDCSNKAGRYCRALLDAGHKDAVVIFVRPRGQQELHAIVYVAGLYCDPSTGKVKRHLVDFGDKISEVSHWRLYRDEELA